MLPLFQGRKVIFDSHLKICSHKNCFFELAFDRVVLQFANFICNLNVNRK